MRPVVFLFLLPSFYFVTADDGITCTAGYSPRQVLQHLSHTSEPLHLLPSTIQELYLAEDMQVHQGITKEGCEVMVHCSDVLNQTFTYDYIHHFRHTQVISVYGRNGNCIYLEALGPSLAQETLVTNFSFEKILTLALELVKTIEYLHTHGLPAFQSIRPENLHLNSNASHLILRDFGPIQLGAKFPTPELYAPPEPQASTATDIFAFGLTFQAMLTRNSLEHLRRDYANQRTDFSFQAASTILSAPAFTKVDTELRGYIVYNRTLAPELRQYPLEIQQLVLDCIHIAPEKRPVASRLRMSLTRLLQELQSGGSLSMPQEVVQPVLDCENLVEYFETVQLNFEDLRLRLFEGVFAQDIDTSLVLKGFYRGCPVFAYMSEHLIEDMQYHRVYKQPVLITVHEHELIMRKLEWIASTRSSSPSTRQWIVYQEKEKSVVALDEAHAKVQTKTMRQTKTGRSSSNVFRHPNRYTNWRSKLKTKWTKFKSRYTRNNPTSRE